MVVEILLAVLVMAVAVLTAIDVARTPSESPHAPPDRHAHAAERAIPGTARGTGARAFTPEPAAREMTAPAPAIGPAPAAAAPAAARLAPVAAPPPAAGPTAAGPAQRLDGVASHAGARQRSHASSAAGHREGSGGLRDWPVRHRLNLLMTVTFVAAIAATLCAVRIVDSLRGPSNGAAHQRSVTSALVAGVVLVVVVALAAWLAVIVTRSVLRPLRRLRAGIVQAANVRMPNTVHLISETGGEGVPLDVQPIDVDAPDELAEVARAFDQVHREALRLAANEASLRAKVNAMFVNVSHRSEALAERQIRLVDDLEQKEQDPERLGKLFKLDHLATRLRRYSQNLLVLAGHELAGQPDRPMSLLNVIKAAASEIEEYNRVSLSAQPDIAVRAPAVNDLVHLLAELIENATSLSSADTPVTISGRRLPTGGVLIEISDHGFGMSADEIARANWRLENPLSEITAYKSMGLFVVGRLAARHGIRIRLNEAESGGLIALVWLPDAVVLHQAAAVSSELSGYGAARPAPGLPERSMPGYPGRMDPDRAAAE